MGGVALSLHALGRVLDRKNFSQPTCYKKYGDGIEDREKTGYLRYLNQPASLSLVFKRQEGVQAPSLAKINDNVLTGMYGHLRNA